MYKYVKKPVVIEAFPWDGTWECVEDNVPEYDLKYFEINSDTNCLEIVAHEGVMTGYLGDFIIKGVNGEYYPCSLNVFLKTYDVYSDEK